MPVGVVKNRYGVKLGLGYIATSGFVMVVGLVTNEVNATIVAAIAGVLTLGSINAAETVASITEMSAQTKRVAEGDIDNGVSSSRSDEFGRLASSIEEMRVSLKQRISEMDAAQEELETARAEAEQTAGWPPQRFSTCWQSYRTATSFTPAKSSLPPLLSPR